MKKERISKNRERPAALAVAALLFLSTVSPAWAAAPTRLPVENAASWKLTGPAAEASHVGRGPKKDGAESLSVDYKFAPNVNDYLFLEQSVPLPGAPKTARLSVMGDGSGISLRINVTDESGEFFQAYLCKVDWEGWRDLDVPLEYPVHWGGNNSGKMEGKITFHSLVFNSEKDEKKSAGRILLSRMELSTAASGQPDAPAAPQAAGTSSTVVLDDFERTNPLTVYQVWKGDNSSIDLLSSGEFKHGGNFAMQISYQLVTTRSAPTWVSASFTPPKPLNWEGVKGLGLWVKGDGSRNHVQISFQDANGRVWIYQDAKILRNVGWTHMEAALDDFTPTTRGRGGPPALDRIQRYEFAIQGDEANTSSGKIWLDDFGAKGAELNSQTTSAQAASTQESTDKLKVGFGDTFHTEYRNFQAFNKQVLFYNSTLVRATTKNVAVSVDLTSLQTDFGNSIPFVQASPTAPPIQPQELNRPNVQVSYFNASIQNLHPNLTSLSVGNLYIDYGPDVFSPLFGFKGIQADGKFGGDKLNYNVFAIKHVYDAYTLGGRFQANYGGTLWRAMAVSFNDRARTPDASTISNGQLTQPANSNIKTGPVDTDNTYFMDVDRPFWGDKLDLTAAGAFDYYNQTAKKDVTNPSDPTISNELFTPVSLRGGMSSFKLRLQKIPFDQTKLILGYRDYNPNFRPFYRADPFNYDNTIADERGPTAEFEQIVGRWKLNLFSDNADRGHKGSGYMRHLQRGSLGVYGLDRWDIVGSITHRRELYAFNDTLRSDASIDVTNPRNEDSLLYELFLGNWFTDTFHIWSKFLIEDLELVTTQRRVRKDILVIQADWSLQDNVKLGVSIQKTGYADPSFEPPVPTSDNFVRTNDLSVDNHARVTLDIYF